MKTPISLRILVALLLSLHVAGCSDDGGGEQKEGQIQDAGLDSAMLDGASADAGRDAAEQPDAPTPDVGRDVGVDAPSDVGSDDSPDAEVDTGGPPVDDLDPTGGAWSDRFSMPGLQGPSGARAYAVTPARGGGFYVGGDFDLAGRAAAINIAHWDGTRWNTVGANPPTIEVHALEAYRAKLYAAGAAGGGGFISGPNTVEMWDGSTWQSIGTIGGGPQATVYDIEILSNDHVLIAGRFGVVEGQPRQNLAVYDGANWSLFGNAAPNNTVQTIETLSDGRVCIGGDFDMVGSVAAAHIACWNGSQWQALGEGTNSTVYDIIEGPQGEIIAGGTFNFMDTNSNHIIGLASWDGQSWTGMHGGVRQGAVTSVRSLLYGPGGELYVGGTFAGAGEGNSAIQALNIARLDNGTWTRLGDGVENRVGVTSGAVVGVNGMLIDSTSQNVVVAGLFSNAGDEFSLNVAKWEIAESGNAGWAAMVDPTHEFAGADAMVNAFAEGVDGEVYVAGAFETIGGQMVSQIVEHEAGAWRPLGAGLEGYVATIGVMSTGEVVVGGDFSVVGSGGVADMAIWDGSAWSGFGTSAPGVVRDVAIDANDTVYAATEFDSAGTLIYNVYMWTGSTWQPLGSGFDASARTLAIGPGGDLFVGGSFDADTSGNAMSGIARWDGSAWVDVGGGVNADGRIEDMVVYDGKLLVVGSFDEIGSQTAGSVALWDGSAWDTLGGGLPPSYSNGPPPTIFAAAAKANGFFLTGTFLEIDGTPVNQITWYDGADWHALGDGLADLGHAMLISDHRLFVGGPFTAAGGMPSYHIAEWDYAPAP